ncbi:MAG: hypothetical protein J6I98_07620 [Clostridia bacterium]|nr:hypothetical protein [Clostridia bacterium]
MKKLLCLLLVSAMLFTCSGCTTVIKLFTEPEPTAAPTPTASPTPEATATPEPTESPEQLLSVFADYIVLLNDCFSETCGAVLNQDVCYRRVYTSSDAMLNGDTPIDVVPRDSVTDITDPTDAALYEITNYTSNADARAYLAGYFSESVIEQVFPNEFLEFEGKLYMVYGSRGYGGHEYDAAAAQITEYGDARCVVSAPVYWFESYSGDAELIFEKLDGHWYLTSFTE